jgi:hypothetical protein
VLVKLIVLWVVVIPIAVVAAAYLRARFREFQDGRALRSHRIAEAAVLPKEAPVLRHSLSGAPSLAHEQREPPQPSRSLSVRAG